MNIVRLTGNRARVCRYRAVHRRFHYVPSPDVLAIIEHHLKTGTDRCVAGVIDYLIRAGHQATTGNGGPKWDDDEGTCLLQLVSSVSRHRLWVSSCGPESNGAALPAWKVIYPGRIRSRSP